MTRTIPLSAVDTVVERPAARSKSKFVDLERALHISPFQKVDADTRRISQNLAHLDQLRLLIPGDSTERTIYRVAQQSVTDTEDLIGEFTAILNQIASEVTRGIETLKPLAGLIGTIDRADLMQFVHFRLKTHFSVGCFKRFGRYIVDRPHPTTVSVSEIRDRMIGFLARIKPRGRDATAISQFEREVRSCCMKGR